MKKQVKTNASKLHKEIFEIASLCFPNETIRQEESIRIDNKTLFLDIYIPRLKIAIECDGIQHSKFNNHFHKDKFAFAAQKNNDSLKEQYCEIEGITIVRVNYNEDIDETKLKDKLIEAMKK